jgi:hypothetical protein
MISTRVVSKLCSNSFICCSNTRSSSCPFTRNSLDISLITALLIMRLYYCVAYCLTGRWQSGQRGINRLSSADTSLSPVNLPFPSTKYTSPIPIRPSRVSAVKKWPHPSTTIGASSGSISPYVFISRRSTRASSLLAHV